MQKLTREQMSNLYFVISYYFFFNSENLFTVCLLINCVAMHLANRLLDPTHWMNARQNSRISRQMRGNSLL